MFHGIILFFFFVIYWVNVCSGICKWNQLAFCSVSDRVKLFSKERVYTGSPVNEVFKTCLKTKTEKKLNINLLMISMLYRFVAWSGNYSTSASSPWSCPVRFPSLPLSNNVTASLFKIVYQFKFYSEKLLPFSSLLLEVVPLKMDAISHPLPTLK